MPIHRAAGVLEDTVDGKAVLIGQAGTHIVELNALGSLVWGAIDERRDVVDLVEVVRSSLPDRLEISAERIEVDVRALLAELTELKLVQA